MDTISAGGRGSGREASLGMKRHIRIGVVTAWPENVVGLSPILQWRDLETTWGLNAYETGDDYTVTLSPVRNGLPFWAQQVADSLAKASGGKAPKPEKRGAVSAV